jgi:hypothetical protein
MTTKAVSDTLKAFFVSGPVRGRVKGVWLSALEKWGSTEARKLAGNTPIFSVKGAAALEPLLADKPISGVPGLSLDHISPPPVVALSNGHPGTSSSPAPFEPRVFEAKLAAKPTTNTEPATATPAAVAAGSTTQASPELLARRDFVFACWDSVAGAGRSAIACQRPTFRDDLSVSAGLYPGDIAASAHSESAAKRVRAARGLAATSRIQNGWTTAAVQGDINKIVAEALSFGLRIPGQSVKGMKIPINAQPLTHNRRVAAQKMLDDFAATLSGDDDAGTSTSPAAAKAREFYERTTGREFRVGSILTPRKL